MNYGLFSNAIDELNPIDEPITMTIID
ncbi:MAG: hypothetical protein RLZZ139_3612, partial [Cyanobacteriota bacterium]